MNTVNLFQLQRKDGGEFWWAYTNPTSPISDVYANAEGVFEIPKGYTLGEITWGQIQIFGEDGYVCPLGTENDNPVIYTDAGTITLKEINCQKII